MTRWKRASCRRLLNASLVGFRAPNDLSGEEFTREANPRNSQHRGIKSCRAEASKKLRVLPQLREDRAISARRSRMSLGAIAF